MVQLWDVAVITKWMVMIEVSCSHAMRTKVSMVASLGLLISTKKNDKKMSHQVSSHGQLLGLVSIA